VSAHVSGQRRSAPEREQRQRRGSKRQQQQQQQQEEEEIDVDAEPDYASMCEAQQLAHHVTSSSTTQSIFGHALLPPLAAASLSSSAAGRHSASTQSTGSVVTTATMPSSLYHPARSADDRDLAPQPSIPSTQQWSYRTAVADSYASQQQPQRSHHQPPSTEAAQRPMYIASDQGPSPFDDRFFGYSSVPLIAGDVPAQAAAATTDLSLVHLPWMPPSTTDSFAAHDTFSNERSLAPQSYAQHQQRVSERRRRLNDEERSLLSEGQKRAVLTLRELESNPAGGHSKRRMEEVDLASNLRYKLQRLDALSGRY
jgi:hypothetical protein